MVSSQEYYVLQGGTNQGFLTGLYGNVLGRSPSIEELAGWETALDAGVSPAEVAVVFLTSQEYRTDLVQNDYVTYLLRTADSGGITAWVDALNAGATDQQVLAQNLRFSRGIPALVLTPVVSRDAEYLERSAEQADWRTPPSARRELPFYPTKMQAQPRRRRLDCRDVDLCHLHPGVECTLGDRAIGIGDRFRQNDRRNLPGQLDRRSAVEPEALRPWTPLSGGNASGTAQLRDDHRRNLRQLRRFGASP